MYINDNYSDMYMYYSCLVGHYFRCNIIKAWKVYLNWMLLKFVNPCSKLWHARELLQNNPTNFISVYIINVTANTTDGIIVRANLETIWHFDTGGQFQ